MTHGKDVRPSDELAYVHARCIQETDKAILCQLETGADLWIPKSLVADDSQVRERDDEGELAIPLWFAEKEGAL